MQDERIAYGVEVLSTCLVELVADKDNDDLVPIGLYMASILAQLRLSPSSRRRLEAFDHDLWITAGELRKRHNALMAAAAAGAL